MSASLRHWPVWAVALIGLLAGIWLADDDTAPAAFTAAGLARYVPSSEARAMVGTWYLADGAPDALDPRCARDLRVHYQMRSADSLGYTLQCTTASGANVLRQGVTLLDHSHLDGTSPRWGARALAVVMPSNRPVLMLEAVDHALGIASVRLNGVNESLLMSRSYRADENAIQAFLHYTSDLQNVAESAAPHTERVVQRTRL